MVQLIKPHAKDPAVEALDRMLDRGQEVNQTETFAPPAGHPRFYELTRAEEDLHSRKNADYAGGGPPMGNFERVSKLLAMYPNFPLNTPHGVAIVYMLKQLDAALWLLATGREGKTEGIGDRLGDIGVYAKLARIMYEEHTSK